MESRYLDPCILNKPQLPSFEDPDKSIAIPMLDHDDAEWVMPTYVYDAVIDHYLHSADTMWDEPEPYKYTGRPLSLEAIFNN